MGRVAPRLTPSSGVLIAIALAVAAALILSDRPAGLTDAMRIETIASLPDSDRMEPVRRYTMIGSGLIPYRPGEEVSASVDRPTIRVGWVYREISALGMPFFARSEFGPVTFVDLAEGRQYALLEPDQLSLLEDLAGGPVASTYRFAWYRHAWGWLVLLALIGWILLRRREARIREDEHWAA